MWHEEHPLECLCSPNSTTFKSCFFGDKVNLTFWVCDSDHLLLELWLIVCWDIPVYCMLFLLTFVLKFRVKFMCEMVFRSYERVFVNKNYLNDHVTVEDSLSLEFGDSAVLGRMHALFLKCSSSTSCKFCWISKTSYLCPLDLSFIFGKREQFAGSKVQRIRGWWTAALFFLAMKCWTNRAAWVGVLS